ncbi:MAG: hypothetical protein SH809_11165 [Rhodothermales bacterium]|nr:hypothetical protein [Rhodothermales bacterium]
MQKKLTITIDEAIYDGLYRVVGAGNISQFIERLLRPHVIQDQLDAAYAEMAADTAREGEALEWAEAHVANTGDGATDETW